MLGFGFASLLVARSGEATQWQAVQSHRLMAETIPIELLASAVRYPETSVGDATDRFAYLLHTYGHWRGRPTDELGLRLGWDTGLLSVSPQGVQIDGRPVTDRLVQTWLLGETHAELQLGKTGVFMARAGKIRPVLGGGAIFDAYALGGVLDVDLSYLPSRPRLFIRAEVLLADASFGARGKTSPLVHLEAGWRGRGLNRLVLFGAAYFDNDNALEPLFADAIARGGLLQLSDVIDQKVAEIRRPAPRRSARRVTDRFMADRIDAYNAGEGGFDVTNSGTAGWLGALAGWQVGPVVLEGRAIIGSGRMTTKMRANAGLQAGIRDSLSVLPLGGESVIEALDREGVVRLLSYFLSVEADLELTPDLAVSSFGLLISGDESLDIGHDDYSAFVSLAPLLPYTSIFFRGGVAANLSSPSVASLAPDAAGLVGGGVGMTAWFDPFTVRAVAAVLGAQVDSAFAAGRYYGAEANLEAYLQLAQRLQIAATTAVFLPGGYFGPGVPPALQANVSFRASFPGS